MAEPPQREPQAWDGFAELSARTRARMELSILKHGRIEGVLWATPPDVIDAKSLTWFAGNCFQMTLSLALVAMAIYGIYETAIGDLSTMSKDIAIILWLVMLGIFIFVLHDLATEISKKDTTQGLVRSVGETWDRRPAPVIRA